MCVFVSELTWEAEMIGISAKKSKLWVLRVKSVSERQG